MPKRRRDSLRLLGYDYGQDGAYFVTVCTHNRASTFGGVADGLVNLSALGQFVIDCWHEIPDHFPHVVLDAFVVMPNHLHGILLLHTAPDMGVPGTGTRQASVGASHDSPLQDMPSARGVASGSLGAIIGPYKSTVTRRARRLLSTSDAVIWQRGYHDRVIRTDDELNTLREYIRLNAVDWAGDDYFSLD